MIKKKSHNKVPGEIICSPGVFNGKLKKIKALLFDWDGIFNDGTKGSGSSRFNEVDSMGINMVRFGYYMMNSHNPYTAIVTGERNETAIQWAQREHVHAIYMNVKNKADVLDRIIKEASVEPEEILFVFDDIHDLSLAKLSGLRILVNNPGANLFRDLCRKNKYCDYITANSGGHQALREISELILGNLGIFEKTINSRIEFHGVYYDYFQIRNLAKTNILELEY